MKSIESNVRKKRLSTMVAVAEGLWNGVVVSAVLAFSAMLIKSVLFFVAS